MASHEWYCRHYKRWNGNGWSVYTPKGRVMVTLEPPSVVTYRRTRVGFIPVAERKLDERELGLVMELLREFPDTLRLESIAADHAKHLEKLSQ